MTSGCIGQVYFCIFSCSLLAVARVLVLHLRAIGVP